VVSTAKRSKNHRIRASGIVIHQNLLQARMYITYPYDGWQHLGMTYKLPRQRLIMYLNPLQASNPAQAVTTQTGFFQHMSRVSNNHYPPAQQNTDFHSFPPTVQPPTKSNTIKGHLNTCMKASRGDHNSLGWVKYLTLSRT
jgi:hypothetical protein